MPQSGIIYFITLLKYNGKVTIGRSAHRSIHKGIVWVEKYITNLTMTKKVYIFESNDVFNDYRFIQSNYEIICDDGVYGMSLYELCNLINYRLYEPRDN